MSAGAEFVPSSFGGGWIIPKGAGCRRWLEEYFGEPTESLAPLGGEKGHTVEPQDVADLVTALRADNYEVSL